MKTSTYYGVEFTDLEMMMFSKYMDNNHIAMNTKIPEERTKIAQEWIKENRERISNLY